MSANSQQKVSQVVEELESRLLMHAPRPSQINAAFLDNRGGAMFNVTVGLDTSTLSRKSATILTAGVDGQFGTADDARVYTAVGYKKGRLTLRANLPVNTAYRVRLNAATIKDINGLALDGEYKSGYSGDGFAGGNYDVVTTTPKKTTVRYTTSVGFINMRLFGSQTPITVANFMHYMNEGAWDTTFFHRSVPGFVVQGGGFNIDANNQLGQVHSEGTIQNEPGISNLRGTVAMARTDDNNPATTADVNSATNQWFFNLSDSNTFLDSSNGGFTVFGQVLDDGSLKVMDAISRLKVIDASSLPVSIASALGELPVTRSTATVQTLVESDLTLVTRVAQLFGVVPTPNVQASVKRSITPAMNTTNAAPAPLFAVKKIEPDQGDSVLA